MKPPHPPPPPPTLSAAESDAPPKKRKLEEVGFQVSPYYKIRAAIANLRGRFLQVCQATDFQKKDAALEILKEIKVVMELSKKMRLDMSTAAEPVKPLDIPAVRAAMNKPTGEVLYGEKNQVPQVVQEKVPLEPVSSQTAAKGIPFGIQQEAVKNQTNHQGERVQGTYVFGGSPIGWNFRTWPGGKAVYYGPTRAEWLARQAAK
ncbi:uncharacterized protein LOC100827446 isoform X1 [Brachypodium distachyon]|uniref:Uncharacterized protein n=1 Tax=Brachypodium distachyon TaxID=15368 RepID=I1J0G7_BRADI|nr:uncharacterized protein LOC100827446 isoform X1 [Brachypodium distachyon]KQJ83995.1 hypothetical protein BRADI_5g18047v3 [Brachypodium distachyon]KQJ83998.1 hypothetical protein BRADI_5g18047v3 [Brachypodium distachyon]|eukprot:XP_003581514.1 uncharacterized protein LOC100827446 isoform X1 [Brachypodium distachyon]